MKHIIFSGLGLAVAAMSGTVQAQSMSSTSSSFETGYGRARGSEERAIDPSTRDASGNRVIVDGVIVTGADNSVYAYGRASGAADAYSGAGAIGGASAIGNNLSVVVSGNYNTVMINSTQINNGNVTANAGTNTATAGADITGTLSNGF
ncbi:holdfast anchoring protein HfaA [Asticcacaulis sp. ZE23SCel15]|uniref:holdfast anchoring protein HfaA n=1 Tax=Asticcacaulis sp. ZE23SCel15 TaxID=3059027 RepID=UPI00265DE98F|nr:holdfast anchoring protein HfaA [Asticcacaulis sp. ZE23SCel15]WKL56978.1 holdfast anchoring protein HfaA [Asticcacaulis sp. ZE23SCel15]